MKFILMIDPATSPQQIFHNIWRHFRLSRERLPQHPVGRGREGCWASRSTQNSCSQQRITWPQMLLVLRMRPRTHAGVMLLCCFPLWWHLPSLWEPAHCLSTSSKGWYMDFVKTPAVCQMAQQVLVYSWGVPLWPSSWLRWTCQVLDDSWCLYH